MTDRPRYHLHGMRPGERFAVGPAEFLLFDTGRRDAEGQPVLEALNENGSGPLTLAAVARINGNSYFVLANPNLEPPRS